MFMDKKGYEEVHVISARSYQMVCPIVKDRLGFLSFYLYKQLNI